MRKKLSSFFVALCFLPVPHLFAQTMVTDATGAQTISTTQRSSEQTQSNLWTARHSAVNVASGCPVINCPGNVTATSDSTSCSATVTFSAPTATNLCAVSADTFTYTGSIVTWTVPAGVTSIHIDARGAQGGNNGSSTIAPGLGAIMTGDFAVTPGMQIRILVGQNNNAGNGGGGGTFVTDMANNPLIVAGGGGGGSEGIDSPNKHGNVTTTGGTGAGGGGTGGTAGNGGNAGASFNSGAGGGLLTNGANGWTAGSGGQAFVNGGAGANVGFGVGGFGGGGNGSGYVVGAGGGGYSGGGGGSNSTGVGGVGGGGGSFNAGTNQVNTGGANTGNGLVIISYTNGSSLTITQTAGLASGSVFPVGVTTQTFVVDDGQGNTDTCSFTVTVNDNIAPVIANTANITVNADSGMCSAVVNFTTPVATDNCAVTSMMQTAGPASGSAFPVGTTTITYTAMDAAGNTATSSFNVVVTDAQAPVITCNSTITVSADSGLCSAVVNYTTPTATDNCNVASVTMTAGLASGSAFPLGTTTITYMAMDSAGNSSSCSFNIVVNDTQAPAIACLSNITVNADSGTCTKVVSFNAPVATDNCSAVSVTQTSGPASGSAFPVGTTIITFTATDSSGNSSVCSFNITVNDVDPPVITCGADMTMCEGDSALISVSAYDVCTGVETLTYVLSGATTGTGSGQALIIFNVGTTSVTYTATDSSGLTSSCSFNVLVNPAPTVTGSASASPVCVNDGLVTLTGSPAGGTWSGTGVSGSTFNPGTAGVGTHALTYTYVDSSGCVGTAEVTVVVNPCTGITENNGAANIIVSPNPTSGALTLNLGAEYKEVEFTLVQVNGQIVKQEQHSNTNAVSIDCTELAAGIYFLNVNADGIVKTIKIVRE